jgi:hypothetical protein
MAPMVNEPPATGVAPPTSNAWAAHSFHSLGGFSGVPCPPGGGRPGPSRHRPGAADTLWTTILGANRQYVT